MGGSLPLRLSWLISRRRSAAASGVLTDLIIPALRGSG
jgi:hypothetical protein